MRPVEPVVLTGRHVTMAPMSRDHVAPLLAAADEARDSYGLTNVPIDAPAMAVYIDAALADQAAGRALPFVHVRRSDEKVVGSTRFGNIEHWGWPVGSANARPPGCPDAVEIGWTWLAASAQRTAVNTEAKLLMLGHAFEVWEVRRLTLKTDARNARSRAAIERLGARLDGILRAHMPAADGGIRDSAVYSILAGEWPAIRDRLRARLELA
jgi:N-acetyltransferase